MTFSIVHMGSVCSINLERKGIAIASKRASTVSINVWIRDRISHIPYHMYDGISTYICTHSWTCWHRYIQYVNHSRVKNGFERRVVVKTRSPRHRHRHRPVHSGSGFLFIQGTPGATTTCWPSAATLRSMASKWKRRYTQGATNIQGIAKELIVVFVDDGMG